MVGSNSSESRYSGDKIHQQKVIGQNRRRLPFHSFRALTRLVIGSIGLGIEQLDYRLQKWEDQYINSKIEPLLPDDSLHHKEITIIDHEEDAQSFDQIKYAFTGILFDTQDWIQHSFQTLNRAGKMVERKIYPLFGFFPRNLSIPPIKKRYDALIDRGEIELNRWISIGHAEYSRSKAFAQIAIQDTTQEVIGNLAENPEVNKLVQSQSMGLANEVVEEVRERSISADTLLDDFLRSKIGRKPRIEIPPPAKEIGE